MTLKDFIGKGDHFAMNSGVVAESVAEGYGKATLLVTKEHLNAGGVCQGGAIFTLADTALALAANSSFKLTLSIDAAIYYHKSAIEGDKLTAEAFVVCANPKIPSYEVKVTNDKGVLVATFKSTCYNKQIEIPGVDSFE